MTETYLIIDKWELLYVGFLLFLFFGAFTCWKGLLKPSKPLNALETLFFLFVGLPMITTLVLSFVIPLSFQAVPAFFKLLYKCCYNCFVWVKLNIKDNYIQTNTLTEDFALKSTSPYTSISENIEIVNKTKKFMDFNILDSNLYCTPKDYENYLFKKIIYNQDTVCFTQDYSIHLAYWEEILPLIKRNFNNNNNYISSSSIIDTQILTKTASEPLVANLSTNISTTVNTSTLNTNFSIANTNTETAQLANSTLDSLKTIASSYNDNMYLVILAGVAVVVGYGIWRYFSQKTNLQAIQIDTSNVIKENIEIKTQISNDIVDLAAEPLTNLVENQIFDDLFFEILQDPSLDHIIQQRLDRQILQEILQKVNDVIIHQAPAMDTTANIISNFPPAI